MVALMTDDAPAEDVAICVLFVDDEAMLLRSIQRNLVGAPFEVIVALGPERALAVMRSRRIDVLVSDIDMPVMTGLELVRLVRREFPTTLRMLLTGEGTLDRAVDAINEGEVVRFFTKPLSPPRFRQIISDLTPRIQRLRSEGEIEAHKARLAELSRWAEDHFPDVTRVETTTKGEVVIDLPELLRALDESGSHAKAFIIRGQSS